ncbi:sensor histidine kinase [Methanospirillum lacunae]|uniref:histidine kinase n=2 Tax=Methanospirillum lacunae TaxID=668570 RepID=A0A2V2N6U0_9EURY|nr:sensor histidine kinase [Methanospirillum lacunae]
MSACNDEICQIMIIKSKFVSLAIILAIAVFLEFIIHYSLKISIVYTHLFYLIIILAAIWFQRYAVWIALFFGVLHITVSYLVGGYIPVDSVFRAFMLCLVAFIVGSLVRCMTLYRDEEVRQNHELEKTQEAFQTANKKLNILSSITRHDILNQLTALLGYQEIAREMCSNPDLLEILKKEENAAQAIRKQIEFTKNYQDIGVRAPIWHNLKEKFETLKNSYDNDSVTLHSRLSNHDIFADPLFPLICQNLLDNSIRHGEHVKNITFSSEERNNELIFVYEDDGIGISDDMKTMIFKKGYGKNTGMGLFLSQEILAITGLVMKETGESGKGVRFVIHIPEGSYRLSRENQENKSGI